MATKEPPLALKEPDLETREPDLVLGIDIGGTGIKGGLVDLSRGALVGKRYRLDTPEGGSPEGVADTVGKVAETFDHKGLSGVTFPGVVQNGVVQTSANVDPHWVGTSLPETVGRQLPGDAVFVNDADAAGLAEVQYGAGRGHAGLVVLLTFGTGIGTALIHGGRLVPNAELGHIEIGGQDAEKAAASSARKREDLTWDEWAARASRYLKTLEALLWPELFIIGGGISKNPEKWFDKLECRTPMVVAQLINNAGIVGAALAARHEVGV